MDYHLKNQIIYIFKIIIMKKSIFIISLFIIAATASAQVATHGQVNDKGTFEAYVAANGDSIQLGDTFELGMASSDLGYQFISQNGQRMHGSHAGKQVTIAKIRSFGSKKQGYKVFLQFKGYGLPVSIDYDNALKKGEIIKPD